MKYTSQRGTRDILPDQIKVWQFIETTARRVFESYNYAEIRTPLFESTELFTRSVGETTDIVTKEMYTFEDKGKRSITLRPEETAPVVRACIENNLFGQGELVKLYYIGPMFRYERPQAGRYRQFYQAGVEVFGSADPLVDVEMIELGVKFFKELGLKDLEVDINSVGCPDCRPKFQEALKKYFKDKAKSLCGDCQKRLSANPLRILDCKDLKCQKSIESAPASVEYLCPACKADFEKVTGYLKQFKIAFKINKRLVRGLDYYVRTTFEIISKSLGAQNAVCGGGRYDNLVKELGGKQTPATGFAIGLDRLVLVLEEQKVKIPKDDRLNVYIVTMGEAAKTRGFEVLKSLREMCVKADMSYQEKSLKSQMKAADKLGAEFVLIIGEDELKRDIFVIKNMDKQAQEEVKFTDLLAKFKLRSE
ncbi:histidine--tRNA ligase [Candidatus Margulisiibacteriota bacterium]